MTKKTKEFNLLLPSLALSLLVFLLVIFITNLPQQTHEPDVSAAQNQLSTSDDIDSLESDLILLQGDQLDQELEILNIIK